MKKGIPIVAGFCLATALLSPQANAQAVSEGFENITILPGWVQDNNSIPGLTNWFQGNTGVFPAQAGTPASYIGANFNNTSGANTISNWLLTPEVPIANGETLTFWTRTNTGSTFPDRLEIRLSNQGDSSDVGTGPEDVGDFTNLLLSINPTLQQGGYPDVWTEFNVVLSGVGVPTTGRVAFRYYVTNGGPSGANSSYIGIDTASLTGCGPLLDELCPADISPKGGNGLVDIDDLFEVIGDWAQTGPPRPNGDVRPLPAGNCLVDIDDLFGIIEEWGNCPLAPNDTCATAHPLSVPGNASGTTVDSVPSAGAPQCGFVTPDGNGRWYVVAGTGTTLTFSTCGSSPAWDGALSVYCGTCSQLFCAASANADSCSGQHETVQVCTQVGTNYYVLVSAAGPGALGGAYTLNVTSNGINCGNPPVCAPPPPPANDECANAIQVFNGVTQTTNESATTSAPPGPTCAGGGAANSERDVWYTYTATCSGLLTVDTCATPQGAGAVNDTILSIYEGTCGNLLNEACDEDTCGIAFLSTVTIAADQGVTYIIRVASFVGSPDGPFTLTIGCTPAKFVCGDGIVDPGEDCDDGNDIDGDGCTNCEGDPCETFPNAVCDGTPDTEPCHVNGDVSGLDPNGGCNSTPPAFGTIAVGEKKCGTISTYTNSLGAAVRDTDWFSFTAPVTGFYTARVCSSFTPQCLFLIAPPCPAVVVGAGAAGTPNVPLFVTRELTADTVYSVFVSRLGGTGDVACPPPGTFNYSLQLTQP